MPTNEKSAMKQDEHLYNLACTDLKTFAENVTAGAKTTYQQASLLITWYAMNFDWTATDYKDRSVQEILERKKGNCRELALVSTAAMDTLGIKKRKIREVNLHVEREGRQTNAEAMVKERGFKASVFGRGHNDHVWLEIYDDMEWDWFPADPSLGVVGRREWTMARLGFGKRFTLDPSSKDMIAPVAIYAVDDNNKILESRTQHYVVDGFDEIYDHKLQILSSWSEWKTLVKFMDTKTREAFMGETNLHLYGKELSNLTQIYAQLKTEYLAL